MAGSDIKTFPNGRIDIFGGDGSSKGGPVDESDAESRFFPKILGEANGNH
jgi:hypothetical protein